MLEGSPEPEPLPDPELRQSGREELTTTRDSGVVIVPLALVSLHI